MPKCTQRWALSASAPELWDLRARDYAAQAVAQQDFAILPTMVWSWLCEGRSGEAASPRVVAFSGRTRR